MYTRLISLIAIITFLFTQCGISYALRNPSAEGKAIVELKAEIQAGAAEGTKTLNPAIARADGDKTITDSEPPEKAVRKIEKVLRQPDIYDKLTRSEIVQLDEIVATSQRRHGGRMTAGERAAAQTIITTYYAKPPITQSEAPASIYRNVAPPEGFIERISSAVSEKPSFLTREETSTLKKILKALREYNTVTKKQIQDAEKILERRKRRIDNIPRLQARLETLVAGINPDSNFLLVISEIFKIAPRGIMFSQIRQRLSEAISRLPDDKLRLFTADLIKFGRSDQFGQIRYRRYGSLFYVQMFIWGLPRNLDECLSTVKEMIDDKLLYRPAVAQLISAISGNLDADHQKVLSFLEEINELLHRKGYDSTGIVTNIDEILVNNGSQKVQSQYGRDLLAKAQRPEKPQPLPYPMARIYIVEQLRELWHQGILPTRTWLIENRKELHLEIERSFSSKKYPPIRIAYEAAGFPHWMDKDPKGGRYKWDMPTIIKKVRTVAAAPKNLDIGNVMEKNSYLLHEAIQHYETWPKAVKEITGMDISFPELPEVSNTSIERTAAKYNCPLAGVAKASGGQTSGAGAAGKGTVENAMNYIKQQCINRQAVRILIEGEYVQLIEDNFNFIETKAREIAEQSDDHKTINWEKFDGNTIFIYPSKQYTDAERVPVILMVLKMLSLTPVIDVAAQNGKFTIMVNAMQFLVDMGADAFSAIETLELISKDDRQHPWINQAAENAVEKIKTAVAAGAAGVLSNQQAKRLQTVLGVAKDYVTEGSDRAAANLATAVISTEKILFSDDSRQILQKLCELATALNLITEENIPRMLATEIRNNLRELVKLQKEIITQSGFAAKRTALAADESDQQEADTTKQYLINEFGFIDTNVDSLILTAQQAAELSKKYDFVIFKNTSGRFMLLGNAVPLETQSLTMANIDEVSQAILTCL